MPTQEALSVIPLLFEHSLLVGKSLGEVTVLMTEH